MVGHNCNKELELRELRDNLIEVKSDVRFIKDYISEEKIQQKEINKDYTGTLKEIRDYQTKQKAIIGAVFTLFATFGGVIIWIISKIWGKS